MVDDKLMQKLGDYVEDAHAMEESVLQMLESMISTTGDERIRRDIERHKSQTEVHKERLRKRLEALGRSTSPRKRAQTLVSTLMKGVADQVRGDKPGKNARDGFVTEHMEIAAYELLERLALVAGDADTALVARQNKREEEMMAKKIASNWDRFLALTLVEAGIEVPRSRRRPRATRSSTRAREAEPLAEAPQRASGRTTSRTSSADGESRQALYEQAKRLGISGRSKMGKDELARAIARHR